MGAWVLIAVMLALLAAAGIVAYQGWTVHGDVDMPASGYVAMWLGILFSVVVGAGLMGLIFYSSRKGYDEPPREIGRNDEQPR
jgi:hypothetical protein